MLLTTILVLMIAMSSSIKQVIAFQQVAGPVTIYLNPGETKSFSWGLIAENNESSIVRIYADGNGSELLSIPQTFKLSPSGLNSIVGNITIPSNYPTNTLLNPIVHTSLSENDSANSGGNAVAVELSKMITISIGANSTQPILSSLNPIPPTQKTALIGIGLLSKGTVNSVIRTPTTEWIASGNWSLDIKDKNVTLFETKMVWNNINGTDSHTHEFVNLRVSKPILLNQSEKNFSFKGLMDVGTNQRIVWNDVPSTININGKRTLSILVDDNMTNHHFASQPILGVVNSLLVCSDIPGPNMVILPPCSEPNSVISSDSPLSGEAMMSVQPVQPVQPILPSSSPSMSTDELQQFSQEYQIHNFTNADLQNNDNSADQIISPTESIGTCEKISITSANASGFEKDPKDYNPPGEAIDSDVKTWWANKGVPSWLQIDLERPTVLCSVEIAWNKGNERIYDFVITTSDDGIIFTDVYHGKSEKSESYEKYDIVNSPSNVKSIKLDFTGSSSKSGWVSIKEINVIGR